MSEPTTWPTDHHADKKVKSHCNELNPSLGHVNSRRDKPDETEGCSQGRVRLCDNCFGPMVIKLAMNDINRLPSTGRLETCQI